ncbi:MAG: HipA domain-containing protein [Clostridia bacterium]|nr:HipA domain-containing protein [Clostridia bacterium]
MKPILKNTHKYTDIKLATGIDLETAQSYGRFRMNMYEAMAGISSKKYANRWFYLPKGRAIFKSYDAQPETRSNRIVNELICQELAKQVGIACAEYEPAHFQGDKGLVSYDVTKDGETLLSGNELCKRMGFYNCQNSLYQYKDVLKRYCMLNFKTDADQVIFDLYKIAVFDALTFQTDRHRNNVFFIKGTDGSLRVAPLIDNELSFYGKNLLFNTMLDKLYRSDLMESYVDQNKVLSVYKNETEVDYQSYIQDVLMLAEKNQEARQIVDNILKKMNITKAIENVEKQGITINDGYKEYLTKLIEVSKKQMRSQLKIMDSKNQSSLEA